MAAPAVARSGRPRRPGRLIRFALAGGFGLSMCILPDLLLLIDRPRCYSATADLGALFRVGPGGREARRENKSISKGKMMRMRNGATVMPLTTTRANGFCTCEPMPVEIAAGNRPTQAAAHEQAGAGLSMLA
jgi:hypothetical protein